MSAALRGPTRREAETRLQIAEKAAAARREQLTAWRAAHPWARCDDKTALAISDLEAIFGWCRHQVSA